jgi:general secretion pathway protein H
MKQQRGFTLIELLVVLAIMGIAVASVSLSLRDSQQDVLDRDAQRLIAQLENARAVSRTTNVAWTWQITPGGYTLQSLSTAAGSTSTAVNLQQTWTLPQTVVSTSNTPLVLGPEPVLKPTTIELSLTDKPQLHVRIQTDGVGYFQVVR